MKISIFWYRRDLRLEDNTGLFEALNENENVLPIFIFDDSILDELPEDDARVNFIYESLSKINKQLNNHNASLQIFKGQIDDIAIYSRELSSKVFAGHDRNVFLWPVFFFSSLECQVLSTGVLENCFLALRFCVMSPN